MGKITGFMELQRIQEVALPVAERVRNYREFVLALTDDAAATQGARCMDCGIPFCQTGCPVNNIIPDWNDLVYRQQWRAALDVLHSTNNFPEFTGRVCPAPCEAACTLNINNDPVGIKSIEHSIIDKGWEEGWVVPQPPAREDRQARRRRRLGPGGPRLRAAARARRPRRGGVREERPHRRAAALRHSRLQDGEAPDRPADGADVGRGRGVPAQRRRRRATCRSTQLLAEFDAVVLAGGAEQPRDLPVPGRELAGIHFAMEFLPQQNKVVAGDTVAGPDHRRPASTSS